ncbi:dienelactone hydrolase family protein [Pseudonocardiaceae bacterium YIM PH 21723]|nr:dienelactone hydrolase family protein [Pseudonocardiaceae bacterium YIM PH 21723]
MAETQGTLVDITTPDGVADAYLTHPAEGGPHPGVLFYMDALGLRPNIKEMADRLAAAGYTVLVPNLFYRTRRAPVFELPEIIDGESRAKVFEQIGPVMQSFTPELAMRDAEAYLGWFAESPLATDGPVGITGYCFGAGLALRTAGTYPERVAAAGGFHGAHLATDQPDSPHLLADKITAELFFGHADNDHALPQEQIDRLAKALTDAGVTHQCEVYRGAIHGFTQADTSVYHPEAAERHWSDLLDLLRRALS